MDPIDSKLRGPSRYGFFIVAMLFVLVLSAYAGVSQNDFIRFDDPGNFYDNPTVLHGLTWRGWNWAWTSTEDANWYPLTKLSHMAVVEFLGVKPGVVLWVNVVIHACNASLLWWVLHRMTGSVWRSAAVAGLFAVHPHHVESVAWLTERKDVLFMFFELITLALYAEYVRSLGSGKSWVGWYVGTVIVAMLGYMSKPMMVSLPVLMLILDYWPLGRVGGLGLTGEKTRVTSTMTSGTQSEGDAPSEEKARVTKTMTRGTRIGRLLVEKIPFVLMSVAMCVVTMIAQHAGHAVTDLEVVSIDLRAANVMVAYATYLVELVWPQDLVIYVPLPHSYSLGAILGSWLLILALSALAVWSARRFKYVAAGWCWYVISLLPVVGLVQVGMQARADRYLYLPAIGIYFAVVWGSSALVEHWLKGEAKAGAETQAVWTKQNVGVMGAAWAVVIGVLWILTTFQVATLRNTQTAFGRVLERFPESTTAMNLLSAIAYDRGDFKAVQELNRKMIEVEPRSVAAYNNLGNMFMRLNRPDQAELLFNEALKIRPNFMTRMNMGAALATMGRFDEALNQFNEAAKMEPTRLEPVFGRGAVYGSLGKWSEAEQEFRNGLAQDRTSVAGWKGLGVVMMRTGRYEAALESFGYAHQLSPEDPSIRKNVEMTLELQAKAQTQPVGK